MLLPVNSSNLAAYDNATMPCYIQDMSSMVEIENATEKLPAPEVDELAGWLEALRVRRATPPPVESWLPTDCPLRFRVGCRPP